VNQSVCAAMVGCNITIGLSRKSLLFLIIINGNSKMMTIEYYSFCNVASMPVK